MKYKTIAIGLFYANGVAAAMNFGIFAATLSPVYVIVGLFNAYAAWDLNKKLKQLETK